MKKTKINALYLGSVIQADPNDCIRLGTDEWYLVTRCNLEYYQIVFQEDLLRYDYIERSYLVDGKWCSTPDPVFY